MTDNLIILRAGDMRATVDPAKGAQCVRLEHEGYNADLLRYDEHADPASFLYGMPPLFPPNRISGGRFEFEGREYLFPINDPYSNAFLHGEMNRARFETESVELDRAVFIKHFTKDEPYVTFPHAFTVRVEYQLTACSLCQTLTLTNDSDTSMPCGVGFHTTFNVPFVKGSKAESVQTYVDLSEEYERDERYYPTGRILTGDPVTERLMKGEQPAVAQRISRHYKRGESGMMSLTDTARRLMLVYRPDPKLAYRLIFNGDATDYICLEPQSWLTDSPNSPLGRDRTGFMCLAPAQSISYQSEIELRPL